MPANFSFNLQRVLTKAKQCGETSFSGVAAELPLPSMKVKSVGRITFPLPPEQAEKFAESAQPASSGRGVETRRMVACKSVRNTLQIDPNHVDIESTPVWRSGFEQLVRRAVDGLGADPAFVEAKLYKLLLFEKGGHFTGYFRRDTDTSGAHARTRTSAMFATLVVQLPSHFSGGEFVVRHGGVEKTYTLGSDDSSCSQLSYFVAHYADCEHAVREVTGGHRLALVYSLCWKGENGAPPTPAALSSTTLGRRLANMFEEGFHANNVPVPMCVHLEHQYTEDSLSHLGIRALKGRDRATADALLAAGNMLAQKDRGNELSICIAACSQKREEELDENGSIEDLDQLLSSEWDHLIDTELKSVFELNGKVNKCLKDLSVDWTSWVRSESFILSDSNSDQEDERKCRENEYYDSDDFDDYDSDDKRLYREQRMSAWRTTRHKRVVSYGIDGEYRQTKYSCNILLLWPTKRYIDVLLQCGMEHALSYVDGASDVEAPALLVHIVEYVASHLTTGMASSCSLLLRALVEFRKPQLVCNLLELFATRPRWRQFTPSDLEVWDKGVAGLFSPDIAVAISDAALALGLAHVRPAIEKLLAASRQRGESQLEARLVLVHRLDLDLEHKTSALEELLTCKNGQFPSIPKAGLQLLLSVNDADWLARFQGMVLTSFKSKKRKLSDRDELGPLIEKITDVLAGKQPDEPGRSVFDHVLKEATCIRVQRFVECVEESSCEAKADTSESWMSKSSLPGGDVVRADDLMFLLQAADSRMVSKFQAVVLTWTLEKLKKLVCQIDSCVKGQKVTPEALSAIREIRAALIDILRKETQHKPQYTDEMREARYPDDSNIEKFLRGPRRTKRIFVCGDINDAEKRASDIQEACRRGTGFSIVLSVGGRPSAFVTLEKTRIFHDREVLRHKEISAVLEALLKEQAEDATTEEKHGRRDSRLQLTDSTEEIG